MLVCIIVHFSQYNYTLSFVLWLRQWQRYSESVKLRTTIVQALPAVRSIYWHAHVYTHHFHTHTCTRVHTYTHTNIVEVMTHYCILVFIRSGKLLLFHVFTFIPQKHIHGYQLLQAFTIFTCKNVPKNFCGCKQSMKNTNVFHCEWKAIYSMYEDVLF